MQFSEHPPPQQPPAHVKSLSPLDTSANFQHPQQRPPSPTAPEYSPITPKAQPVLPATAPEGTLPELVVPPPVPASAPAQQSARPIVPPVQETVPATLFIPQPPSKPFSSEDSTDAIALRAAISALQFQKKKAADDVRTLVDIKQKALADPLHFRNELAAGKLSEERSKLGDIRAILDASDSDDDDDEDEEDEEDEAVMGAKDTVGESNVKMKQERRSGSYTSSESKSPTKTTKGGSFSRIPGPQNVIRMPHVNWDKYHVVGEPLDAMHEQQRRWPGTAAYGPDKGREHAVAAPYSPFYDSLDGQQHFSGNGLRKDSAGMTPPGMHTPTGSISEHPMHTRAGMSRPS